MEIMLLLIVVVISLIALSHIGYGMKQGNKVQTGIGIAMIGSIILTGISNITDINPMLLLIPVVLIAAALFIVVAGFKRKDKVLVGIGLTLCGPITVLAASVPLV